MRIDGHLIRRVFSRVVRMRRICCNSRRRFKYISKGPVSYRLYMPELTIREILDLVPRGQIRVPAFQRGFVWDPDQVAYLMDSIYK